jgi:hypothetical protein
LLGISGKWEPVYDDFGDPELLAPLHHRAIPSDWQIGWRAIVRAVAVTPLFRPWLYLLLALALIYIARNQRVLRALVLSGVVYEATLIFVGSSSMYRYSHWLITSATIAGVTLLVSRRAAWRRSDTAPNINAA